MSHKKFFAGLTAVAFAGVAYAAPTGPINKVMDAGPPVQQHSVVNPAAFLTCTGFELAEGWDAGFQICGANFAAGCGSVPGNQTGGFANVCVPKNHAASINCCFNDPNDQTGWFMSGSSQHCQQPSIQSVHPSILKGPSIYHLRFQYDPMGGNPNGCNGFGGACRQSAFFTDGVGFPAPLARVATFKVDIAGSATLGSNMTVAAGEYGPPAVYLGSYGYFYYLGGLYQYDFHAGAFVFGGYWSAFSPDYAQYQVELDPCNDTVTYSYGGLVFHVEPFGFIPPNSTDGARPATTNAGVYITDHFGETWDLDNQCITYGAECSDACCDGTTGICTDGVPATACMGDQQVWHENNECANITCVRHSGACCDRNPGAGGPGPEGACTEPTFPEDCVGQNLTWYKSQACADIVCDEIPGACCDLLAGTCANGVLQAECGGAQQRWDGKGSQCGDVPCDAVRGACCDGDTFGGCEQTTQAGCGLVAKGTWYKLTDCGDIDCRHEAIPTVSSWGLVVLTLLLLTGAKVYFGRRQALA